MRLVERHMATSVRVRVKVMVRVGVGFGLAEFNMATSVLVALCVRKQHSSYPSPSTTPGVPTRRANVDLVHGLRDGREWGRWRGERERV